MSKKEQIRELEIKNNALRLKYNELVEKLNLSERNNVKLRQDNQALSEESYRLYQENGGLRKDNQALGEENTKLHEVAKRMSREKVAAMSSGRTLTEIINIHCGNNQKYFKDIMCLLSQREQMRQQLNEKDYIICQLESALEAAKVI